MAQGRSGTTCEGLFTRLINATEPMVMYLPRLVLRRCQQFLRSTVFCFLVEAPSTPKCQNRCLWTDVFLERMEIPTLYRR